MPELGESLSERELDVLQAVADGLANKEIALKLSISPNTVKVHLRNIYTKLGAASRTEATMVAIQQGALRMPGAEELEPEPEDAPEQDETLEQGEEEEGETAVTPPRSFLNRTEIALIVVTVLVVILIGLFSWQSFFQPTATPPEPFVESAIGETRWKANNRPMPEGRAGMAVTAVGLDVYAIGGETAVSVVDTVSVYDTAEHLWRGAAAKPTAVTDVTAAVLFGEIYVPGGRLEGGEVTAVVEVYSPANDAWRPIAALPQPVAGGLALSDGSFLYLFGGWNGETYLDTAYVYDPGADSWRPLESLAQPRAYAAGEFVTGRLYVVGGYDGIELAVCQAYDPIAAAWSDCPDMLLPRAGAGAAVLLNKLYILGGGLDETGDVTYSELFDPVNETWQVVNTPLLTESPAWAHVGVANVETQIYVLGGRRGGTPTAETLVYSPFVYQTFIPAASAGK